MSLEDFQKRFSELGKIDFSQIAHPKISLPEFDYSAIEATFVDPEDTIMGDIKRQIIEQNDLASQQIGILLEQNKLLGNNYEKLKEMYEAQVASYESAREDLRRSRNLNRWMTVVAVISMLAAMAGPVVTIIVSG